MKPDNVIFIGVILSVLGALTAGIGTWRKSISSRVDSDKQKLEITSLKQQNQILKDDLTGYSTGGDSYLDMMPVMLGNDFFKFIIIQKGKYPLSNVEMWYINMNGWDKMSSMQASEYQNRSRHSTLSNLGYFRQNGIKEIENFKFDKNLGVYLQFHFFTNNGTPTIIFRGKWVNNKWVFAKKIITGQSKEPIYDFDPDYPARADKDSTINDFY
ncbi:hypothetical protein [Epilithonimonas hispanica]|uniref:Uncharacterized protein n=1 Tax=Epilithonimonas hispanica TaxID=358687 RepID=A0A3D9D273_9FLAO|nr:hypothetical protein [Epilithonimonas hispanica]REC72125.1 hypothetical protein DRF58_04025 [Epilithonimonas hispanica]